MIKGKKEELDDIAKSYKCPEHDNPLVVAWHDKENCYVIRCGNGHYPDEVKRIPSLTEELQQGLELPEHIKANVVKSMVRRAGVVATTADKTLEGLLPHTDLGNNSQLTPVMVQMILSFAEQCGLVPFLGHVVLFYGKPYVTIDGYLYYARKSSIRFSLHSRPLTPDERKTYLVEDGSHAWTSEVILKDTDTSFTGLGIVTQQEIDEEAKGKPGVKRYPVVANKPWQMAQKRAEWQALRRAFPIGE